jgi:murein DD-endopeptidase MepM/ murein hydrolase activator NlpD
VVFGFYLSSLHFQRVARNLSNELEETQETFNAFQEESEQVQSELIDATVQMYEQLSEEQMRSQLEINRQERRHQDTLEDIWEIIDDLEIQIQEFEEERQGIINGLSTRSVIPPIASLLSQMEETQNNLRDELRREVLSAEFIYEENSEPTISLLHYTPLITEDELLARLSGLVNELEIQRTLFASLESYKEQMSPYLLNYPTIWPISGRISSGFGWRRNPFGGSGREHHNGVDIPARTGTPIRAAGGGIIISSGWQNGYGNTVVIDHGGGLVTKYAHNSRNTAREGQRVERGDIIGYVGSTGRSTGAHLHYEIRRNGTAVNPIAFLIEHYS